MEKKNAPQVRGADCETMADLRSLRISRGITVENVSSTIQVCSKMIEQWESGDRIPSAVDIIKLSTVYGCSLQEVYKALLHTPTYRDTMAR